MVEKEIIGIPAADSYNDAALLNTASPHPIPIGVADMIVENFLDDWEIANNVSALKMFSLAWSSLRSATLTARMGMVIQVPPVQRQAMEATVYGILFHLDEEFHDLWKERHSNPRSKARFRREGWKRGLELIRDVDGELNTTIQRLYDDLIDIGAHPNPMGVAQMSEYNIGPGAQTGKALYSQLLGQPFIDTAHAYTAQGYLVLLEAMRMVWADRAKKQKLDIEIVRLRKTISTFLETLHKDLGNQQA